MTIIACEVSLHATPWGRSFDDALAALEQLPNLYTELDGSFAWNSLPGEEHWQLFGCLYDRGPELAYVDLFGTCNCDRLKQLFGAVRGTTPLMVQSRTGGTYCTEAEFLVGRAS